MSCIHVVCVNADKSFNLAVKSSDTILDVKVKIAVEMGLLPIYQNIWYGSRFLKNNCTIDECGIKDSQVVHMLKDSGYGNDHDKNKGNYKAG